MSENVYTAAIPVAEMFVDRSYQRELDERRAHRMGATWDPRLVGVLDVADRGEDQSPRYAVVNGQHRWAAASHAGTTTHLAANVHTGLTVADEAALFRDIDLSTKKLSTWDRWKARRAAGDDTVLGIDRIAEGVGLKVAPGGATNALGIVRGLFEILRSDELDEERLVDALVEVTPTQLHARAVESRKIHDGQQWQCVVRVIVDAYNQAGRGKVDPQIVLGAA